MIKKIGIALLYLLIACGGYYLISHTIKKQLDSNIYDSATSNLLTITPFVFIACAVVGVIGIFKTGQIIVTYLKWNAFGNRLKIAYSAKFGGANPAFDEEVNNHIKVMESMGGKSQTRDIAEDWLKRMANFVEVPFAIPEEEHLSEEEKTDLFDDNKDEQYDREKLDNKEEYL